MVTPAEWARIAIGIFVVFVSMSVIVIAWWFRGIEEAQAIAAVLSGLTGIVIGYFFGRHGVTQVTREREQLLQKLGQ